MSLDLATNLGWAWHSPGMPRPVWDHRRLPGTVDDVGQRCDVLERTIHEIYLMLNASPDHEPISHIIFEKPFVGMHKRKRKDGEDDDNSMRFNPQTAACLYGLAATVEKIAFQAGILCYDAPIGSWRKHFIGKGSQFGADNPKVLVQERCNQLGWHTATFDESDALGVLDFSLAQLPLYERPWRDNALMRGRR